MECSRQRRAIEVFHVGLCIHWKPKSQHDAVGKRCDLGPDMDARILLPFCSTRRTKRVIVGREGCICEVGRLPVA